MDSKRFFTSMLVAGALMLVFMYFFKKSPAAGGGGGASTLTPFAYYKDMPVFKGAEEFTNREANAQPEPKVLGDIAAGSKTDDKLELTINNVTAGLDLVRLRDYAQSVGSTDRLALFRSNPDEPKPFATTGIHIKYKGAAKELLFGTLPAGADNDAESISRANATALLNLQYVWKYGEVTPTKVTLFMTLQDQGKPLVKITKTYEIRPGSYDITISHTVENFSGQELQVAIDQLGAIEFPRDDPSYDDRFFMGTRLDTAKHTVSSKSPINITHLQLPKMLAGGKNEYTGNVDPVGTKTLPQMHDYAQDPTLWVASSNRFFTAIIRPAQESSATDTLKLDGESGIPTIAPAHHVDYANIDFIHVDESHPEDDVAIVRFTGAMMTIPAGTAAAPAKLSEPIAVYLGPKKEPILEGSLATMGTPEYEHAAFEYINIVQFNTCWLYSLCVSGWLVFSILKTLDFFATYITFHNYGLAIMLLVILVRLLLHPLTRMSQINMAKMGKQMKDLQPKIDAMKKRYADNKEKQSQEMMKLYRENHINPAGGVLGCLPMALQMPIWAALMSGLRLDIDLRHASFIPGWINDLSNPDTIFPKVFALGHPLVTIPLLNFPIYGFNLLPILLAITMFLNMQVTMASQPKPADEQQANMQKWSKYSIFIMPIFMYNMPSGSNLYIFASTIGGLIDMYFIRKSLKKQGILPASAKDLPTSEPTK